MANPSGGAVEELPRHWGSQCCWRPGPCRAPDRRGASGGRRLPSTTGPVHGRGGPLACWTFSPGGRRRSRMNVVATAIFVLAILHTFAAPKAPAGLASPAPEGGRRARPGSAQLRGRAAPPAGRGGGGVRDLVRPAAHRHPPAEGTALGRGVPWRGGFTSDVRVRGDGDRFHPAHPPLRRASDGSLRFARWRDSALLVALHAHRSDRYSGHSLPSRPR